MLIDYSTYNNSTNKKRLTVSKEKVHVSGFNQVKTNFDTFNSSINNPYLLNMTSKKVNRWNVYEKINTKIKFNKKFKELES